MMRGDSLRDFYAKALALFGLALLGALGAAVDYWPANVSIPQTGKPNLDVATLQPLSHAGIPEPRVAAARVASRPRPVLTEAAVVTEPAVTEVTTIAANVPATVTDAPQAAADLQLAPPASFTGLAAATDAAIDLTAIETPVETFQIATVAAAQAPKGGVFSTIGNAGSAVVDSLQLFGGRVGGAIKGGAAKLWPFRKNENRQRQMLGGSGVSLKPAAAAFR